MDNPYSHIISELISLLKKYVLSVYQALSHMLGKQEGVVSAFMGFSNRGRKTINTTITWNVFTEE